jgi:hypothetical protein
MHLLNDEKEKGSREHLRVKIGEEVGSVMINIYF